jgi:formimidoylglutamate deiminase
VFCEHGGTPIRDVFVGGRQVVEARRHVDEEEAFAQYRTALDGLLR